MTRELPNNFPYIVTKQYISSFVDLWNRPSYQLFEIAKKELSTRIQSLIKYHFESYTHGHLRQRITYALRFLPAEDPFR